MNDVFTPQVVQYLHHISRAVPHLRLRKSFPLFQHGVQVLSSIQTYPKLAILHDEIPLLAYWKVVDILNNSVSVLCGKLQYHDLVLGLNH